MNKETERSNLYSKIAGLLQTARQNVVRAVNQTMVYTYFEIGRMIVEDEQRGKERAEYGKQVLKDLSNRLTAEFGKGFSVDNLQNMRQFFLANSNYETTSRISSLTNTAILSTGLNALQNTETYELSISETISRKFNLSWSHYLKLMRIKNPAERSFYEIECAANNWSLKELQRQFDSDLYERLALSKASESWLKKDNLLKNLPIF